VVSEELLLLEEERDRDGVDVREAILWLRLLEDVCSLEYATLIRWLSKKIHGFGYGQGSLV